MSSALHEAFSVPCGGVLARAVVVRQREFSGELVLVEPSAGVMREPFGVMPRWIRPPDVWQGGRLTTAWRDKVPARVEELVRAWMPLERWRRELCDAWATRTAMAEADRRARAAAEREFGLARRELKLRLQAGSMTPGAYTESLKVMRLRFEARAPAEARVLLWQRLRGDAKRIVGADVDMRAVALFFDSLAAERGAPPASPGA